MATRAHELVGQVLPIVVIVVIAVLAIMVAPNVFKQVGEAKNVTARSQIEILSGALDAAAYLSSMRVVPNVMAPEGGRGA